MGRLWVGVGDCDADYGWKIEKLGCRMFLLNMMLSVGFYAYCVLPFALDWTVHGCVMFDLEPYPYVSPLPVSHSFKISHSSSLHFFTGCFTYAIQPVMPHAF